MPSPTTYDLTRGMALALDFQVLDANGDAVTSFLDTDTLAAKLWRGENLAADASPAAAWVDADTASFRVTFAGSDSTGLPLGLYRLQATATRSTASAVILDVSVRLNAAPGSAVAPLAFASYDDVRRHLPWAESLVDAEGSQLDFLEQLARATTDLIDDLCGLYSPARYASSPLDAGYSSGFGGGLGYQSDYLRQWLLPLEVDSTPDAALTYRTHTTANAFDSSLSTALHLTPAVKEIVARRAIAEVMEGQVGRATDRDWAGLAAFHRRKAVALYLGTAFGINTADPQTYGPEIVLRGGSATMS